MSEHKLVDKEHLNMIINANNNSLVLAASLELWKEENRERTAFKTTDLNSLRELSMAEQMLVNVVYFDKFFVTFSQLLSYLEFYKIENLDILICLPTTPFPSVVESVPWLSNTFYFVSFNDGEEIIINEKSFSFYHYFWYLQLWGDDLQVYELPYIPDDPSEYRKMYPKPMKSRSEFYNEHPELKSKDREHKTLKSSYAHYVTDYFRDFKDEPKEEYEYENVVRFKLEEEEELEN